MARAHLADQHRSVPAGQPGGLRFRLSAAGPVDDAAPKRRSPRCAGSSGIEGISTIGTKRAPCGRCCRSMSRAWTAAISPAICSRSRLVCGSCAKRKSIRRRIFAGLRDTACAILQRSLEPNRTPLLVWAGSRSGASARPHSPRPCISLRRIGLAGWPTIVAGLCRPGRRAQRSGHEILRAKLRRAPARSCEQLASWLSDGRRRRPFLA